MAFNMQEFNVLRLLLLVLSTLPLIKTTNIDCNGKAFHCVNSTHFMICVDIGRGLSSTVDDFVIPCPMNTECRITNRFECDYPPTPTTTTLPTTSVLVKDFTRTVNHMETTSRVANNVKYPNTVSLITETNGIDKSAATEPIDSTTGFDFADLKNLMEQSLSPLLNEAYTENYLQLSTLTSGRDEVTTDIPATTTMSTDKMITGTVTKIVGIAKIIGDSPTYSSQYDTTPISAVSAPSLKDFASKYNVYEDVLMGHSPNENIELLADVDFELHNLEIAPNSELYVPSEVLANEIYKNVDDTNAEMISSIANDMGNTLHTSKMDTVNSNINDTVTTKSSLSSKNGFLTHNTKASTDISITPGDISHTPPKYVVPTDSKLLDTSTFLISDFSIEFTTEPATIQDSTMMLTSNALPAETLTEIDNIPFLEENVFYSTVPTQIKEITAKEPKPVNDLLPENYAIRDTSIYGTKISEKPSTIVEDYTYPTNGDSNDLTTEMAVSFFSFHKYVDKALEKTTTDIGTINFGKQDITETSSINVVPTDSIVIDSSTALINDFVSEFTTELLNIQDSTVDLMSYALSAVTEIKNVPFKSNNMFYGTEVTQTDEKITDVTQVNVLLIEEHTLPVSNTLKRTISELPVTVVDEIHMEPINSNDNDFTSAHTETTFTTASYSKVFDGVSSKNTDAETAEDIGTKAFTDNNIPSKYYTPDQPLKPTEATSTSYLFEYNDQDLEVTEHAVTTISTDLKHSLEPSNKMLSTSSHAKKTYVDLAKSKNYAPDNDLLSTVANEVVESATEFYVQVKSNQSFYKTNLSRNVENFTVPVQVVQHKTGRHGEEITKKDTDHSSVIQVNTESITKTTTNINTDSQKISTYDAELIFLSKVDKTAEKETDKPFISRVDYTPKKYDTTTTFTSDSNVGFATSTPITSQVNIQEILTEPERHTMVPKINKIPNKLFILSNTDQMQRQDVTESFRPTLVTRDINKEINKNIDVRFAATDSTTETDSKSYNKNNVNSNVLRLATKDVIKSQTTVNITENEYETYLGTVSKENNESITTYDNIRHDIDSTTSKDMDVTVSDSLEYGMEIIDRLNLETHVITSSTKYGTEATPTEEKRTDDTQVNVLLIEEHTLPVSNTLKRTISELPVTVVDEIHMEPKNSNDNDFTSAHTETTFTTAPYSKVFDGVSSKNTDAETAEDIGTKVFTDNNIPSKYYTPDQPLKPTEATSTSYLFEYNDQDLEVTEHAVTTISTDLKHSLEPSNKMLSTSSHAKKTYVDLAKSKNYAPDNDLLSTVANEVVESATEFYVQVKSNQSFYKTNLSRNVENFTVPVQVVQHKTGRHGEEITKKDTDHSSVIQVNTESITKTTTNINTDSQKISTYDAELIFLSKVDKTAEKETDKPFISRVDYTPEKYDTTTTFTTDSNVAFATSAPITSQVNIQELLTEPERQTIVPKINKIPNKFFISSNTDQMQRQDATKSFRSTLVTRDINKEINKNIDVRFAANSTTEADSKSYNKNNVNSNVLHLATKDLVKSQTIVNITENKYQTYLGTVSKENNESITTFDNIRHDIDSTTSKDMDVTVSDSLDYRMEIIDRLNLETHVITSSTKYGTEATQTEEKRTDDTQVNVLLIEEHTLPVSNTLKRTISELPVTVVDEIHMEPKNSNDNDFTSAHTETTFTTASYSKVFDDVSSKNTYAETAEDIATKAFTDNNIPSKYYTPDQPLKPTEATSTSYLFEHNNQDLEVTEHAATTISTDLKHFLKPSNNMLSTSSHAKKSYVDLAKSKNYAPDNDLLSTVANEVVESATEFYDQVESNRSIYKPNLPRNVENFTVPVQVVQHKTGRHGEEITEKDTDHSSVIQVNTESITKTTTNINTDSQKISTYDAELIFLSKVDKTAEKETDKRFISRVDYTPKKYDTTTTFTSDSNVGFATSTPITSQVNIQEILTEPERHTMFPKINKIPNKLFILTNTDQMQRQDVTESFRPTLVTRDINKEISKNIDVRFAANDSISEGDSKSYNKNNVNSNVLHLATKELIKSQTTVNITENKYQTYLGTVSKENNESITTFNNIRHNIDWTTSKDLDVTVSDSLDYGMEIKDRLNLEKHVITSSTKYVHTRNKYREQDVVLELGNALSSTNSKDIQTDQLTNITEHITVTESYKEHNGNLGYKNIKTYEETPTILPIQLQSTNNVDVNITVTDKSNNKDSVTFDILEYKNKSYAGYENITESNNKKDIIFTIENKISLNASANYSESTRQNEAAAYIGNKIKGTYNTRELSVELTKLVANISSIDAPATISNQNLSLADNSTLQTNIKTQKDSKKSGFQPIAKVQIEVTNAKDITDITNVDFNSEKNTTQTSTKEITKLNKYVILGKNENKEVVENMNYDNIGSNNTYNHMTNTIANSTIPEMVLRTTSDKPVQTNVIKIMTESYHASKIHNSVPSLQNTTAQINASKNISQKDNAIFWNNKAEKLSLNNLLSSHTIKPVNEDQSAHDPKKVENGKPTTLKSFGIDLNRTVNFDCLYRFRGKYADNTNCRKFYICIGKPYPIIGMCPVDTVFSEYRKQCTKSLAHCVRNHVFYCTSEGRFTDIFTNNMYYICVRTIENKFIRYKLQCDDGYHLNKALVQCTPNAVVKSLSKLLDSDKSQRSSSSLTNSSESLKSKSDDSICQKEGKIPNPNDCRKYFVCSKKKLYFKKKVKSCDSDEVFDKQKEKCVDAESYEC